MAAARATMVATSGAGDQAGAPGIVHADVASYLEVLRAMPDPILLAMRNLAEREGIAIPDPDTATLLGLLARLQRSEQVVEVGTGIGYLTLHLARALPEEAVVTSIERDPTRQAQAHAFLDRDEFHCAVALRLGDPARLIDDFDEQVDLLVLGDVTCDRLDLVDRAADKLAHDALVFVPGALRDGYVAQTSLALAQVGPAAEQRTLNRRLATDVRFADVLVVPVGDGVLLARRL